MPTYQNILINSLKESFVSIWKNKSLFILLLLIQIVFLIVLSALSYHSLSKIMERHEAIYDYLSQQRLDDAAMAENMMKQKGILGDDPLSISRNFKEIVKNFKIYMAYVFSLLIVFISISWTLTIKLISGKKFLFLIKIFFKMLAALLFYLGLIFSFFYSILSISFMQLAIEPAQLLNKYIPFLALSIVLAYFMFISASLLQKTELKNIIQRTLSIGIRKAHYIMAVYFFIALLLGASFYLLLNFLEKNIFVLMASLILLIFTFVFGRILMMNIVEKLSA